MFTKEHYKAISEIAKKYVSENRECREFNFYGCYSDFVIELAKHFQQDNTLFDKSKFLKACRVSDS